MSYSDDTAEHLFTGHPTMDELRPTHLRRRCVECGRRFDLTDETQAQEWFYGHDCEGS